VCMYGCMDLYQCPCISVLVWMCVMYMYVWPCACMYVCMDVLVHVWMYECMYVRTYGWMYICMYVNMYVCMNLCMYVGMHVCMHGSCSLCDVVRPCTDG
jgi:hypothetical protein